MKLRIKSMIWNIRKQKTTNQNNKKKKRPHGKDDTIDRLWDNFRRFNIRMIGRPKGEEKEQEIGNLFEKIVKENFPNLMKEIDMQVQEAQRVPKRVYEKKPLQDTS